MIKLNNVTKIYQVKDGPETVALKDVTLDLPEQGYVFIVGKSGSGKSTMLNILGGLDSPTKGELLLDGQKVELGDVKRADMYRKEVVGFVFQEFNLLEKESVEENIMLSTELVRAKNPKEIIANVLKEVDLEGYEKKKAHELSGGQRQRVAIARALAKDSRILIADEPTGALDSENAKGIFEIFKRIAAKKLVVVVTHDEESASQYAQRVIRLKDGVIISDETNKEA